jgi:resuscitation-promoting factor RpfB
MRMRREIVGGAQCSPYYTPCVPIALDVDCANASGDGPAYVDGPVDIQGGDPYGLDGNNDGVGCT